MPWTTMAVLLILWLLGFSLHVAGGLIHLLLVVALVVLVINLLTGDGCSIAQRYIESRTVDRNPPSNPPW
jgi:hypothetical protein